MRWFSKESEKNMRELVRSRHKFDEMLEERRKYGGYTGPVGPTIDTARFFKAEDSTGATVTGPSPAGEAATPPNSNHTEPSR